MGGIDNFRAVFAGTCKYRRELTNMAEENRIGLAGWDGPVRVLAEWRNRDEFVENAPEGFPARDKLEE